MPSKELCAEEQNSKWRIQKKMHFLAISSDDVSLEGV